MGSSLLCEDRSSQLPVTEGNACGANALRANEYISSASFQYRDGAGFFLAWTQLCQAIATCTELTKFRLDQRNLQLGHAISWASVSEALFQAVVQNENICDAGFKYCEGLSTNALTNLLNSNRRLECFLLKCSLDEPTRAEEESLVEALGKNTGIELLALLTLSSHLLELMFRGLMENAHLEGLAVGCSFDGGVPGNITELLESTTSIQRFKIMDLASEFDPIFRGLINSRIVTDVRIVRCIFDDFASTQALRQLICSKKNLLHFEFSGCMSEDEFSCVVPEPVLELLAKPDSQLKSLWLDPSEGGPSVPDVPLSELQRLFNAVRLSKLERLFLGGLSALVSEDVLRRSFSTLGLSSLTLKFNTAIIHPRMRKVLFRILQHDYTIENLDFQCGDLTTGDLLEKEEIDQFSNIVNRNRWLGMWVKRPTLFPVGFWPEMLYFAQNSGTSTSYQALQSILQSDDWLSNMGKRRRKRPRRLLHDS